MTTPSQRSELRHAFFFITSMLLMGGFVLTILFLLNESHAYGVSSLVLVALLGFAAISIVFAGFLSLRREVKAKERAEKTGQQALLDLAKSETQYRSLNDASNDAVIIMDQSGAIISWNKTAHAMFGYYQSEALGKPFDLILPKDHEVVRARNIEQAIHSNEAEHTAERIESEGRHKSGKTFPIEITFSHWTSNGTHFSSGAIRDITEEKRIRDQLHFTLNELKRSNEELEQFAYIASHDLQEPLRKIRAFGDRMLTRIGEDETHPCKEYAMRMVDAAQRMQVMVQDLLSFSRVSRNLGERERVDLNEVVAHAVENLQISIREAGAELYISKLPVIQAANPTQMLQLFQNLISNGVKFRNEGTIPGISVSCTEIRGSEITHPGMEADPQKTYYQISVKDNGVGFDEKYLDKVFTIFQRLHGHGEYSGTGIGLAVCKRICENHNGFITAKTALGKGAEFIVYLPKN